MRLHVSFLVGVSFPVTHAGGLNTKLGLPDSFLLDGLGCAIHVKCVEGWETKTLLQCGRGKLRWLLTQVCRRELIVCSAVAQVFNGPNRELYYNGITHVFLSTKQFCRQIRQFCIITKTLSREFWSLSCILQEAPGPLTAADYFPLGRLRRIRLWLSAFGTWLQHGGHRSHPGCH